MIIIYDFDGTLTPYSLPQYEILNKCGYTNEMVIQEISREMKNNTSIGLFNAYYKCYRKILNEHGFEMSKDNVCLGADNVKFNSGVIEYFNNFQSSKTGVKHYIVTSGIKDYVEATKISSTVNGIYGVTFVEKDNLLGDIDFLLTDEKKVDIIKKIQKENNTTNQIIYVGDGLTDRLAFEYVHSIGGRNIFITTNEESIKNFQKINANGIIDECFEADFGINSKMNDYIQTQIHDLA